MEKKRNNMKQTAVEWLVNEILMPEYGNIPEWVIDKVNEAKAMEKEQHQETWETAHQAGRFEGKGIAEENWQVFETYWVETFKSE